MCLWPTNHRSARPGPHQGPNALQCANVHLRRHGAQHHVQCKLAVASATRAQSASVTFLATFAASRPGRSAGYGMPSGAATTCSVTRAGSGHVSRRQPRNTRAAAAQEATDGHEQIYSRAVCTAWQHAACDPVPGLPTSNLGGRYVDLGVTREAGNPGGWRASAGCAMHSTPIATTLPAHTCRRHTHTQATIDPEARTPL